MVSSALRYGGSRGEQGWRSADTPAPRSWSPANARPNATAQATWARHRDTGQHPAGPQQLPEPGRRRRGRRRKRPGEPPLGTAAGSVPGAEPPPQLRHLPAQPVLRRRPRARSRAFLFPFPRPAAARGSAARPAGPVLPARPPPRTLAQRTALPPPASCTQILAAAGGRPGGGRAARQSSCAPSTASRTSNKPSMRPRLPSSRRLFSAGTVNSSGPGPGREPRAAPQRVAISAGRAAPRSGLASRRAAGQQHGESPAGRTAPRHRPAPAAATAAAPPRREPGTAPAAAPPPSCGGRWRPPLSSLG